jgi:hypothetical protein
MPAWHKKFYLCVAVFYCGARKSRNLSLYVEEIQQRFGVKNAPNVIRNNVSHAHVFRSFHTSTTLTLQRPFEDFIYKLSADTILM